MLSNSLIRPYIYTFIFLSNQRRIYNLYPYSLIDYICPILSVFCISSVYLHSLYSNTVHCLLVSFVTFCLPELSFKPLSCPLIKKRSPAFLDLDIFEEQRPWYTGFPSIAVAGPSSGADSDLTEILQKCCCVLLVCYVRGHVMWACSIGGGN